MLKVLEEEYSYPSYNCVLRINGLDFKTRVKITKDIIYIESYINESYTIFAELFQNSFVTSTKPDTMNLTIKLRNYLNPLTSFKGKDMISNVNYFYYKKQEFKEVTQCYIEGTTINCNNPKESKKHYEFGYGYANSEDLKIINAFFESLEEGALKNTLNDLFNLKNELINQYSLKFFHIWYKSYGL